MPGPRLVFGDPLGQQRDVFSRGCATLRRDHQEPHRCLEQATAGEREIGTAQCVLADLGDPERDLTDLEVLAAQVHHVRADQQRILELAACGLFALALGLVLNLIPMFQGTITGRLIAESLFYLVFLVYLFMPHVRAAFSPASADVSAPA